MSRSRCFDRRSPSDDAFVERFRREARNAAALLHPNIVTIHDTGVDARSGDYIVMSLVDGLDLREVIARDGPLAIGFTVRVGIETARALQFAHEHGIVHRDIKPANILIGQDGEARVADFGIARAASDVGGTTSGAILGSAQYASPEQVSGEPVSPRSDVYSLGIVLYEALPACVPSTGRPRRRSRWNACACLPAPCASSGPTCPRASKPS